MAEIHEVRSLFPAAQIHFMHPIKARSAIRAAYFDYGVRTFVLDSMAELKKITDVIGAAADLTLGSDDLARLEAVAPRGGTAGPRYHERMMAMTRI